jgi:hypothetical protein
VKRVSGGAAVLALLVAGRGGPARAYDPATTHAGLTERAVMASTLHRVLARQLGRPLGLFEPVALDTSALDAEEARSLLSRLTALDSAGGYRPGSDGVASAVGWVVAGAVIAQTPPERGGNLFYDPSRGSGLSQGGGLAGVSHTLRMLLDGAGGVRGFATGTSFDMTGRPSTVWLTAPDNDLGLPVFYAALETAVAAEAPAQRSTATVRALLALGGTLSVLEDAGEPAHVRNDFRRAFMTTGAAGNDSPFDRGSAFERFVAESYGRLGVPPAATPVVRPTVMSYITAADAQGLADRTQRRFFSDGTVPEDGIVDRDTTAADVLRDARESLPYGLPGLPHLDLRTLGERRYVRAEGGRRLLAYERVPGRVRFFLDDAVYADSARVLLPEIGAYGAGLVDHLFRAEVRLDVQSGAVTAWVAGARGAVRGGQVRLYAQDAKGRRRLIGSVAPAARAEGAVSVAIPAGTRRLAAVVRGEDDAGPLVAVAEQPLP